MASRILENPPAGQVGAIDRLWLALWLYVQGKAYWPGSSAGTARRWLEITVRPFVEEKLGNGRIENDADDAAILRTMDCMRAIAYGFLPGDPRDPGSLEGNPFLTALGKDNNVLRHILGEGGRERIGYLDIPDIFEDIDRTVYRVHSMLHRHLNLPGRFLRPIPTWEHVDVPWHLEEVEGLVEVELDPTYEPHPVIRAIMDKDFSMPGEALPG